MSTTPTIYDFLGRMFEAHTFYFEFLADRRDGQTLAQRIEDAHADVLSGTTSVDTDEEEEGWEYDYEDYAEVVRNTAAEWAVRQAYENEGFWVGPEGFDQVVYANGTFTVGSNGDAADVGGNLDGVAATLAYQWALQERRGNK